MTSRSIIDRSGYIVDHNSNVCEKSDILSFAGITEKTRIRKPPGGDTNDIFGMEDRQRLQTNDRKFQEYKVLNNAQFSKINIDISADQEEIYENDSSDFNDILNQLNASKPFQAPSYHLDKENLNIHSDNKVGPFEGKFANKLSENNLKDADEEAGGKSKSSTKKYFRHNPITGEVIEVQVTVRTKLADFSNIAPTSDRGQIPKGSESHRTTVRVRQPPGGASSNIF